MRPEERLSYWNDVVCQHYTSAACLNRCEGPFDARLTFNDLGSFGVGMLQAPRHVWSRDARNIRKDGRDDFHLSYISAGHGRLSQGNREYRQDTGRIALYDARKPFRYELDAEVIVVKIPRDILLAYFNDCESLCVTELGEDNALRSTLGDALRSCVNQDMFQQMNTTAGAYLGSSIFNMFLALVDLEIEGMQAMSASQLSQLDRGKRFALANLANPGLTVDQIADRAAVSHRTLNRLFAKTGTTPMRWVWQQRLKASHQELTSGRVHSVTDVAFRFGFSELSHFSRSFKAAYGVTPQSLLSCGRRHDR